MKKNFIYGYCRISTMKQSIQRQIDNIKALYSDAVIITEEYTGTKMNRPKWNELYKNIKPGDTIVFDEVSRMSRNAAEGFEVYKDLYDKGVNLVFIKEPHINTSVYRDKLQSQIDRISGTGSKSTDKLLNNIIDALHEYTIDLAKEQIELAFRTAQNEVDYLHKRTSEGIAVARANGKQIGRVTGIKVETKKAKECKQRIFELSKDFKGSNTDVEVMKILGIARNTYYKYKSQLKA